MGETKDASETCLKESLAYREEKVQYSILKMFSKSVLSQALASFCAE
jgi:hypothetical protein